MENKQAFPRSRINFDGEEGMSLLEYYAGQALMGILCNEQYSAAIIDRGNEKKVNHMGEMAYCCFIYAEAMIKEAEKRSE